MHDGMGEGMEEGGLRPSGCLHQRLGASVPPESEGKNGGGLRGREITREPQSKYH